MSKILYYLVLGLVKLVTLLPMWVLYGISDILFVLLYFCFGYRKKVVRDNVVHAFPQLSEAEISRLMRKFYRHFCNIFIETLSYNGHPKRALRSIEVVNIELIDSIFESKRHVVCLCGHFGNWETAAMLPPHLKHTFLGVYKPLSSKLADRLMQHNRALFGAQPVAMADLFRKIVNCNKQNEYTFIDLIADQRPAPHLIEHWLPFFGRQVPVIIGPEKIARKFNCPVVYMDVQQIRRGQYQLAFSLICENASELPQNKVIELYYQRLEDSIRKQPWAYLWTHKRWKFVKE